jgi:predicted ATPase
MQGQPIRETTLALLVERFSDFGELYMNLEEAKEVVGSSSDKFEEYFTRNLSQVLTWQVPHGFKIKYQGRDLRHHSLGQRASALIIFVLSQQDNDLILIDQPEDDLDSQTIYEDVIKLVRQLKTQVQFIFATHNANFPVLGDAEQVISCSYLDDEISVSSGSIDNQQLQREVVNIMEGGSEAFKQRRKIYEMWDE